MRIKVQKLVGNVSPFSGISFVNKMFDNSGIGSLIDNELGERGRDVGFSYSDIIKNLACVFLAGGSYIEDINTHFGKFLSTIPNNNVPSADTILRGLGELKTENTKYVSDAGKNYNFNINRRLNHLIKNLTLKKPIKRILDIFPGLQPLTARSFMLKIVTAMPMLSLNKKTPCNGLMVCYQKKTSKSIVLLWMLAHIPKT